MPSPLIKELQRRHVIRAAGVYLVAAWLVLQAADIIVPALHLPDWVLTLVLVLLVLCFPLAIVLAWIFDLTPQGLKRMDPEEPPPVTAPDPLPAKPGYRFADFELDVPGRELRRGGESVVLQPRVFDLLVYLLQNRGRAVSKDELQDAVWTGMIVTDASLTRAVMKLRTQGMVKTVHGHGYRFVAQVDTPGSPPARTTPSAATTQAEASRSTAKLWVLASLIVVLIVAVGFGVRSLIPRDMSGTRVAVLPVVNTTGDQDLAWVRLGLMSFANELIGAAGDFTVVKDSQIVRLTENTDPDDVQLIAERLRRAFGATHILQMELERAGGMLRMSYRLIDAHSDEILGTMVDEDATVLTRGVARSVVASVAGQRRMRSGADAGSSDPFLNEAFARGLSLSLEGRCSDARPLFKVIIDQEPELFEPRYHYAACSRILGDQEIAEEMLKKLVQEQRGSGPTRRLARALQTLGVLYNRTGRLEQAEVAEMEGLEIAETIGDQGLAGGLLTNLSIIAEDYGDFARARELLGRALVAYEQSGREVLPGQVYSALSNLASDQGEYDEAGDKLEQALESFRFIGDRRSEAMMLNNKGLLRRNQGRLEEAETLHLESYALREELGDRVGMGRVRNLMSGLYLSRGQFSQALDAAQEAAEIAHETRDRLFEGTALAAMGSAEVGLGDLDAAERHYKASRAVFEDIQDRMRVLEADILIARIDMERGAMGVRDVALRLLDMARIEQYNLVEVEALELLADIAARDRRTGDAISRYSEALSLLQDISWGSKENEIAVKLGEIHISEGSLDAAEPLVGLVSQQPVSLAGLQLRAHFAYARQDAAGAADFMSAAKALGDGRWNQEDERDLDRYLAESR
jgi:DNA-binding winged helix-turn-helix (wHTH) protein/tetratricopeptide (TPR) repeat protein